MRTIKHFNEFIETSLLREGMESYIGKVDSKQSRELINLCKRHNEIFKKYNLPQREITNIKNSFEDTVRAKLGENKR